MRLILGILVLFISFGANAAYKLNSSINISDRPAPPKGSVELLVTMDGILVLVMASKQYSTNRYTTDYLIMNVGVAETLRSLPIAPGLTAEEYEHFVCRGTISENQLFELSDCVSCPL